ncbi:hypothetical protein BpHYR1_040653 [Brachionus plicatilis]|uniref:Uncharacterized protein n=1 Tax=Brachionus plicatilis TaxID=10195 RepID=A0A3M7PSV7_BRAPC|nr:hypothetical protein BpHYR1_040653 [Brachionus plicatilis]
MFDLTTQARHLTAGYINSTSVAMATSVSKKPAPPKLSTLLLTGIHYVFHYFQFCFVCQI